MRYLAQVIWEEASEGINRMSVHHENRQYRLNCTRQKLSTTPDGVAG